jgi:large subunit ribosomal protein L25
MMSTFTIEAQERDTSRNPRQLRADGLIPATIYGKGLTPESIQLPGHEFAQAYLKGNDVYELKGLGKAVKVQQLQIHTVTRDILNIEFMPA